MYVPTLTAFVALMVAVTSITPPGTIPSSSQNLTIAFGSTSALNGVVLPRDETANAPTIGTDNFLYGTYTLMMVDLDIPTGNASAPTSERLHWMQAGFVSSKSTSTVVGKEVYILTKAANTTAFAAYNQPNPPAYVPYSHRYVEYLLNTTDNIAALNVLSKVSAQRANFNASGAVTEAGVTVVAANFFNVTNASFLNGSVTSTTTLGSTSTASVTPTSSGTAAVTSSPAMMLRWDIGLAGGIGAMVAAAGVWQI